MGIVSHIYIIMLFFDWILGPKTFLQKKFTDFSIQDCEKNALYTDCSSDTAKEISDFLEDGFGYRIYLYDYISPKYIFDFRNQGSIEVLKYYRFAVNEKYIIYYLLSYDKTSISKCKVYCFNNEDYYK